MTNKMQPPSRRTRLWAVLLTPILAFGALTATAVPANAAEPDEAIVEALDSLSIS